MSVVQTGPNRWETVHRTLCNCDIKEVRIIRRIFKEFERIVTFEVKDKHDEAYKGMLTCDMYGEGMEIYFKQSGNSLPETYIKEKLLELMLEQVIIVPKKNNE